MVAVDPTPPQQNQTLGGVWGEWLPGAYFSGTPIHLLFGREQTSMSTNGTKGGSDPTVGSESGCGPLGGWVQALGWQS